MMRYFVAGFLFLLFAFSIASEGNLKCYQWEGTNVSLCTDDFLKPCPTDEAFDACLTRVYKTKTSGPWHERRCVLRPCSLNVHSGTGFFLDDCKPSGEEYDCVSCCKTDGCNKGVIAIPPQSSVSAISMPMSTDGINKGVIVISPQSSASALSMPMPSLVFPLLYLVYYSKTKHFA